MVQQQQHQLILRKNGNMVDCSQAFNAKLFHALSYDDKKNTLNQILCECNLQELVYVRQRVSDILGGDFLSFLPTEISVLILGQLDPFTLGRCCLVSSSWNDFVKGPHCSKIWWESCSRYGISLPVADLKQSTTVIKDAFGRGVKLLRVIGQEHVSHSSAVNVIHDLHSWVTCLAYNDTHGLIIAACEDRGLLAIDTRSGKLHSSQLSSSQVSCIATRGDHVACGHFNGSIKLYILSATGLEVHRVCTGHTGAVYSIGMNIETDHMVSGSSDKSVRFWDNGPFPILSLDKHRYWVTEVLIIRDFNRSIIANADFLVVSKSQFEIMIWEFLAEENRVTLHKSIQYDTASSAGLFTVEGNIIFGYQTGEIFMCKIETGDVKRFLRIGAQINGILACGSCFIVLLFQNFSCHIYSTTREVEIVKWRNPGWDYSTRVCNAVCVGLDWLSGIRTMAHETFNVYYSDKAGGIKVKRLEVGFLEHEHANTAIS